MKKLAYIFTAVLVLAACAKEEIHHPSESEAPQTASAYTPVITVDQEINQVTFSVTEKGVIPVWLFQDKNGEYTEYKAQNGLKRIFASAGDYTVRMKIMAAAGITPDYVEKTFHIDNTIANFDKFLNFLAGGTTADKTKTWHIDGEAEGHMGCGPAGTPGLEWWSAKPGDKEAFGVYEDLMTFGGEGAYTYNPGADGATYVNVDGVSVSPFVDQKGDATADYNVTVAEQNSTYKFEMRVNDLYLVLAEHTLFPYIDNDGFWANPEFKVLSASRETFELVHDNGDIAWHFLITSKAGVVKFKGFNYNADSNLWKPADEDHTLTYWYAPGWNQIADPETEQSGAEYTLTLPEATTDQWQAQFFINPTSPVVLSADKNYDYSVIVNTNLDLPGLTLKLTDVGDDGNFLFTERKAFPAGETIFYLTDLAGIDAPNGVKMVFDFGGNAAGTVVSLANIVVKDHAVDDGTVLPTEEEPEPEPEQGAHYDIEGATNFWRSMTYTMGFYTAHGGDWAGLPDTGFEADDQKFVYKLTMPEATDSQWQRQVAFHTTMTSLADKFYDFCCTLTATRDIPGVTIKLVKEGDDNVFYFADRHDVKAYEPFEYKMPNMAGIDMEAIALFFDFGGNPADTEVVIKDICFQEHQEPQGGSGAVVFDYNSEANLWKAADEAHTYSQYYAPGWAQLPNPEITQNGNAYSFYCPEATTDQWQNQFFIIPADAVALSAGKTYDFQCKVELSQDVPGVTFKLTDTADDGNFLFTERRDIGAYEEFTFTLTGLTGIDAAAVKMVFDFGGNPADTEVTIREIILQEHAESGSAPVGNAFDYNADDNLWKAADAAHTYSQYTATGPSWDPLPNPEITQNGSAYSFTYETETSQQWQAQFFIIPNDAIALSAGKTYDFQCKVELSQDVPGVTFKLTDTADDGNFLFAERRDIAAYDTFVFELTGLAGIDAAAVKMVFDFGGCPAGTEVTVKDIILREHK